MHIPEPQHPIIQLIAVTAIRPNTYNPNRMSRRQTRELVAEIRHLGQLPHPIVVRPLPEPILDVWYEIVDGEHRYHAAVELCMVQVQCVVLAIDEFESRRQTIKRNFGGKTNKVLLGDTYRAMQTLAGKSRRQLAQEINIPEATIRAAEEYAGAGDLRKVCAPTTFADDIGALKQKQVDIYLWLPAALRDKWFDAGADIRVVEGIRGVHWTEAVAKMDEFKLTQFVVAGEGFGRSLARLAELAQWLTSRRHICGINCFAQAAAGHGLGIQAMEALPFIRRDGHLQIAITVASWEASLALVAPTIIGGRENYRLAVDAAVRAVLTSEGVNLAEVLGPQAAEDYAIVALGPQAIRDAYELLALSQQRWLAEIDHDCLGEDVERVSHAKELTVATLRGRGRVTNDVLEATYRQYKDSLYVPPETGHPDESDPAAMLAGKISEATSLTNAIIADRPAPDVLRERLDAITSAEFNLLLRAVEGSLTPEDGDAWLAHVRADFGIEY
jgi:ParB-like chromosome segregation protein Spo0J